MYKLSAKEQHFLTALRISAVSIDAIADVLRKYFSQQLIKPEQIESAVAHILNDYFFYGCRIEEVNLEYNIEIDSQL